jgi:hypothetical protein
MECSICLSEITGGKKTLLCKHVFCTPCLKEWYNKADTCPMCRGRLYFRGMNWEKIDTTESEIIEEYIRNIFDDLEQFMSDVVSRSIRSIAMRSAFRELKRVQVTYNMLKHVYEEDDELIEELLEDGVQVSPKVKYQYFNDPVKPKETQKRLMKRGCIAKNMSRVIRR